MTLLPNGDVLGQIYGSNQWALLTPVNGSYINGTWTMLSNAPDSRTYYSTQVLENGNVFMAGGEYGSGGSDAVIYNPVTNTWTPIPSSVGDFEDADSEILSNGDVLDAVVYPAKNDYTYIYNPTTNTWSQGPKLYRGTDADEQNWVKLADGSILMPDGEYTTERYIPGANGSIGTFVNDATDAIAQTDSLGEFGQGALLPDGKAFYVGTGSTTEIYTPSGYNSTTGIYSPNGTVAGTWSAGPTLPSTLGTDDAPIAVMPDGNVLFACGPIDSYNGPTTFYIYNYASNTIAVASGAPTVTGPPYISRFLDLPDGTVLMSNDGPTLYDYSDGSTTMTAPSGAVLTNPTPTITSIAENSDGSYLLTGTQLNGNSEGAYYGDDAQENSNYPIVRLTSSSGKYYFARTYNWSSDGVDTGTTPITTDFTLPLGLAAGTYTVNVMVNGFISANSTITTPGTTDTAPTLATPTATPSPSTGLTTALAVTATNSSSSLIYTWAVTGPTGDATPSFSTNGTTTSNDVTATFQQAGTYKFTVTATDAYGLSAVSSTITVVVNQTLTSVVVTPNVNNLTAGQTQQLTATGYDQFGNAMSTQPTFTWNISGSGTVSTSGLYTSPSTGTLDTVTATTGSLSATASMYVVSSPWVSADIGSPGVTGTAYNTGTTFNVSGAGLDVYNTEDHFHYVYQPLGGNGEIIAEVASEPEQTTGWEKAGVMIRATLDESSQQADISVTPGNGIAFQYRTTAGDDSYNVQKTGLTAPYWVKMVRNGNVFTGYYSPNGTTWTELSSTTITMSGTVYVGLFLTSQSDTVADNVTFSNVGLLVAPPQTLTATAGVAATLNVLTTATGPSGDTLTLTAVTQPSQGTVTFNSTGGVTYTSNSTAIGQDSFVYTISDGVGDTATGTVTVSILGLQAYYRMNEGTGTTTADATGDGYTATLDGTTWGTGVDGTDGLVFNGSGYATVPALNLNTNTVTLSGWIDISGAQNSAAGIIFERDGSNGNGLDFYNSTTLGYTWGTNASTYNFNSGLKPTIGTWTFVALVINGSANTSNATIYMEPLGGTMTSASQTLSLPAEAFSSVTGLGEDPSYGSSRYFLGSMDEVRIYNVALSAASIASIANLYPTVATPASATPTSVTTNSTALSVQGADYAGASVLTYTWAATTEPSGATVTFSPNGTNAANASTATVSKAGTYVFTVTIADQDGLSITSATSSVTFTSTATAIVISPANPSLVSHGSQTFTAVENDQFGNAMPSQPTFVWSSTGSGSINSSTGVYTAGYATGSATVTATAGSITQNTSVTVTNTAPTISSVSASPTSVSAKTANLSVTATDDAGIGNLIYTWATVGTPPAAVSFSANGNNSASATVATFSQAGTYNLAVTVTDDGGLSTTSSTLVVTVVQTLTSAVVSPATTTVHENSTQPFTATAYDQFGNALITQPTFSWSLASGIGSINSSSGVYTSPASTGSASITATSASVSASASITISDAAPVISATTATPSPVTGQTAALSVTATDVGGSGTLTYTWAATSVPMNASAPTYTGNTNGTSAASSITAHFTQHGTYTFTVTVSDGQGQNASGSVNVTVNQTLTTITVSPSPATVSEDSTQAFTAAAYDQFGTALAAQPTFIWSLIGIGSINSSSGLYTAPASTGTATVSAAVSGSSVTGTSAVTVQYTGPTIAQGPSATPSTVTGTTTALSVLGAISTGESNLSYTWSTSSRPQGATTPTFNPNGTNAAKNTTATFYAQGSYTFSVLVTDTQGAGTISATVNVMVSQTLTYVTLASTTIAAGNTTQATAKDQFQNAMLTTPAWSATGGSITSAGLFTAGSTGGSYTITATSGAAVNASVTVVPTTFSGTTGNDTYAIRLSPANSTIEQIFVNTAETATPTYSLAANQLSTLTFTPASDGTLTVDFSYGNPLPTHGLTYNGGSGLFIKGATAGGMAFSINSTQVTDTAASSSPIAYSNIQTVQFNLSGGSNTLTQQAQPTASVIYDAGAGSNALTVNGGSFTFSSDPQIASGNLTVNDNSSVIFSAAPSGLGYSTRNLYALKIGSAATATLTASTDATDRLVLETGSLSVTSGGTLDVGNNAMIVHNGTLSTINSLVTTGLNNGSGYWNGTGITSSSASTTDLTAVGVISNNYNGSLVTSSFDNQSVSLTDVLVKYTYVGDANLDGAVDGSDYTKIDNGFNNHLTGWINGDFNYDGTIDGSDYTLIDNAYNTQGQALPVAPTPVTNVSPVAYYKFNNISGSTAVDSSGNGNTATIHGSTVTTGVDATTGLAFNGTSDYVSVPALNLDSNTVTLSGWIDANGSQTTGAGLIFNRTSDTANGLSIGPDNRLSYSWGTSASTSEFNSNLTVPEGQWTFVAVVITPQNATLYMQPEGGEITSATSDLTNPVEPFSSATQIGADSLSGKFFKGAMDEVRVYNTALTGPEILTIADLAPTIVSPATSTPSATVAIQTALTVQAASQAGAANLTYTWSVVSAPADSVVTFSTNGNPNAYSTTATGTQPGKYVYMVTISDPAHLSVTSSVSETFDVNPFDIAEINYPPSPRGAGVVPLNLGNFVVDSRTPDDFNSNSDSADRWVLVLDSLTIVGPYSQMDLGNNDMIIHNTTAEQAQATLAYVQQQIALGYGQGGASNWTYNGIISSIAAENGQGINALTVMLNVNADGKPIYTTFDGQAVTTTDVIVINHSG
jgi:hypothetical protein